MISDSERKNAYIKRLEAELEDLRSTGVSLVGSVPAPVCLVKGAANESELSGVEPFSGMDGEALSKSLNALGYPENAWTGLMTQYIPGDGSAQNLPAELVRLALEVIDAATIVLCDDQAAESFQAAFGLDDKPAPGQLQYVLGRRVLALGGFEEALGSQEAKQVMWFRLKQLTPEGEPLS